MEKIKADITKTSTGRMIRFACPNCGQFYEIDTLDNNQKEMEILCGDDGFGNVEAENGCGQYFTVTM